MSDICIYCGAKDDKKPCLFNKEHQFSNKIEGDKTCEACGKPFYEQIPGQTICGRRECLLKIQTRGKRL